MTDSIQMLRLAHQMRTAGDIPEETAFWAVENPLTNDASRIRQKVIWHVEHGNDCLVIDSLPIIACLAIAQFDVFVFLGTPLQVCWQTVQVDAGAEVILTQPPLLWDKFEQWMNDIVRYVRVKHTKAACKHLQHQLLVNRSDAAPAQHSICICSCS